MSLAMFTLEDNLLVPTDVARSMWSPNQMHGVAISGALARGLEQRIATLGRADLQPARYTVDLFKPAEMAPCTVTTEVVREGTTHLPDRRDAPTRWRPCRAGQLHLRAPHGVAVRRRVDTR